MAPRSPRPPPGAPAAPGCPARPPPATRLMSNNQLDSSFEDSPHLSHGNAVLIRRPPPPLKEFFRNWKFNNVNRLERARKFEEARKYVGPERGRYIFPSPSFSVRIFFISKLLLHDTKYFFFPSYYWPSDETRPPGKSRCYIDMKYLTRVLRLRCQIAARFIAFAVVSIKFNKTFYVVNN